MVSKHDKLVPTIFAVMRMSVVNANVSPVGCGSEGGRRDELVTDLEEQLHGMHPVPVALRICVTNHVETAYDESQAKLTR